MPVRLVKLSLVSFCKSTIGGLFTISTLMLWPPPEPPPPAPLHATSAEPAASATASRRARFAVAGMVVLHPRGFWVRLERPAAPAGRAGAPRWRAGQRR